MSETKEPVIRRFDETLRELDRGRVHSELSERLHELIAAAKDTGKGGKITFTLTVTPDGKTNMMRFATQVAAKMPQAARSESLYFVDRDGNPSKQDPHQLSLIEANEGRVAAVAPISKEA